MIDVHETGLAALISSGSSAKTTARPSTRLTDMIMNQMKTPIHPLLFRPWEEPAPPPRWWPPAAEAGDGEDDEEMRSSDRAKEVLLQAAPMIMKEPAKPEASSSGGRRREDGVDHGESLLVLCTIHDLFAHAIDCISFFRVGGAGEDAFKAFR